MRILLTGITGYIGRNLSAYLVKKGEIVAGLIRPGSQAAMIDGVCLYEYYNSTQSIVDAFSRFKPDIVIHLATCFIGRHTTEDIEKLIDSNILLGTRLLEAMYKCKVNKIINTSTVWQHVDNLKYAPVSLYAATKQAMEDIVEYYVKDCGFSAITLVLGDNYGTNDSRPKILNLIKKATLTAQQLKMSPGEQEMNVLFIDDVIRAFYIAAMECIQLQNESISYDVMSDTPITLRALAEKFEKVNGVNTPIVWGAKPYRDKEIMIAYRPAKCLPNWRPMVSLEEGLKRFYND